MSNLVKREELVGYAIFGVSTAAGFLALRKTKLGPGWGAAVGAGVGTLISLIWWGFQVSKDPLTVGNIQALKRR